MVVFLVVVKESGLAERTAAEGTGERLLYQISVAAIINQKIANGWIGWRSGHSFVVTKV